MLAGIRLASAVLFWAVLQLVAIEAVSQESSFVRGSGEDLEFLLKGKVVLPDGSPAADFSLHCEMTDASSQESMAVTREGNLFHLWVPSNRQDWFSILFRAKTPDGQIASETIAMSEIRQRAIEGIELKLAKPSRFVTVRVVDSEMKPVPNAHVIARTGGQSLQQRTNESGCTVFELLSDQRVGSFTCWTDDYRIGGYQFARKPTRNPDADEHIVELSNCRNQKIRVVDEAGKPVPDLEFQLQIATPVPNFNYIGLNKNSRIKSDKNGDVVYRWFPDWNDHHMYAELFDRNWVTTGETLGKEGETLIVKVKRSRFSERKRIEGRVVSSETELGGFFIELRSFEEEGGRKHSFTDASGKFYADVLPNATYCVYAQDVTWVSNLIDAIPFSTTTGTTVPELRIQAGQEIEILATVGPEKKPLEGVFISLIRNHEFEFLEKGEVQHGSSGPQWFVKTNKNGRATTRTLSGTLEASVRSNEWNVNQEIEVVENMPTVIQFHREAEKTKIVKGKLIVESGKEVSLEGTEIRIGTIDGKYDNRQTTKASTDGTFSFSILGGKIGVFACTKDGKFAGLTITDRLDAPIEVGLKATAEYRGRLVSAASNEPLSGYRIRAMVFVSVTKDPSDMYHLNRCFEARRIEDLTDEAGYFTLRGMPTGMKAELFASSPTETRVHGERIDRVVIDSNEKSKLVVKRLGQRSVKPEQQRLDAKFKQGLRDCQLNNFRLMVIDYRKSEDSESFVRGSFFAHHKIPDVSNYIQILKIRSEPDNETKQDNDVDFLAAHQMKSPEDGQVLAYMFDAAGTEIARIEIDSTAANASEKALEFLREHAPPKVDAAEKWKAAFEEARQTDRKVWVRVSQRYCAPCFEFSRWLDDHREVLAKDIVMLKIDDVRDQNGVDVARRLKPQPLDGVPFHAIFDASENLLLNSSGVGGNIGFPSESLGINHLRKMLTSAKKNMTEAEIEKLIDSLNEKN